MITMTELAKMTGVSQATVSRVLNGNTSVKPEVAEKVLACAKKYNYQPNMIARSLNGKHTCLLAVMVPDISNPFFADMINKIEREAGKAGYSIMIFNSDYDQQKEQKHLDLLQQYRVDGLLVAPVHHDEKSMRPFRKLSIPWMVITNRVKDADSVYISHEKAGRKVAEHLRLAEAGNYVFIGAKHDQKFVGFERGLTESGVDTSRHLKVFWEQDREKMLELMVEYLCEISGRVGIFAFNDMEALVVMNALMRAGIAMPEKAALVGFDNTFISKRVIPGITSIDQPMDEMCSLAVTKLLEKIQKKEGRDPEYTELEAKLVIRASSSIVALG